jgi:glyoxylase-like metal-dependent hydrolase (beta-lactamase superfamily II)
MNIEIKSKSVGQWNENSYCIYVGDKSILIDPGDDFESLKSEFQKSESKFHSILLTHGHFDHIGAAHDFQTEFNIPTYLHSKDIRIANQANLFRKFAGDATIVKCPKIDFYIDEIKYLTVDELRFDFHHTPGHSLGSVCIEIEKKLFCGDVILEHVIGRSDLPGGNYDSIVQSIHYIADRFEDFEIYPGHGNPFILNSEAIDKFKMQLK